MDDATTGQVSAQAAEVYEQFFVPALFGQWPERLLETATVAEGHHVLDVGCGTGVLARAAYAVVGSGGAVEGVDPNAGMLAVARRTAPEIRWTLGAAEDLPVESGTVDRVLSQFALMFFSDRAAGVSELARVLRPGGRVCVATWAELSENPGYDAFVALLRTLFGDPAADALVAPFTVGRRADLSRVMETAFDGVDVVTLDGTARFESVEAWVSTDARGWILGDLIDDEQFAELLQEAPHVLADFCDASGRVAFPMRALVATAG
jgi:ubiquinone/menaquinone biosynthesis C-methylase UbiE